MARPRLELFDGHLVADAGGRFLLDTGSPVSFSSTKTAHWAGQDHELAISALGLDAVELSRLVGSRLDGLLGGDLLGLHPFTVDLERGFCTFDEPLSGRQTVQLPIRLMLGVPLADLDLDGTPTRCCIDTGARLSYVEEARLRGREAVGETEDFYPGFGTFQTSIYEIAVGLGGLVFTMRAGLLPVGLSAMLESFGIAAILGTELFQHFPVVTFDYPAARAVLVRNGERLV
jgi:hypothetical protein